MHNTTGLYECEDPVSGNSGSLEPAGVAALFVCEHAVWGPCISATFDVHAPHV